MLLPVISPSIFYSPGNFIIIALHNQYSFRSGPFFVALHFFLLLYASIWDNFPLSKELPLVFPFLISAFLMKYDWAVSQGPLSLVSPEF